MCTLTVLHAKNPLQLQNKNSKTSHGIRKFELDEVDRFVSGLKKKKRSAFNDAKSQEDLSFTIIFIMASP